MKEPHEGTRAFMRRAVRRLSALEYVILVAAVALALMGGALAAWFLNSLAGFPFGVSWAVASILLFVLPGLAVFGKEMRRDQPRPRPNNDLNARDTDGG